MGRRKKNNAIRKIQRDKSKVLRDKKKLKRKLEAEKKAK